MALSFARKEVVDLNAVLFAAGSIAVATCLGSILGGTLTNLQRKTYLVILTVAAGVMLCAAVQGLLMPASDEISAIWVCVGIAFGVIFLDWMNTAVARLMHVEQDASQLHGMMYVFAIAIHHLPEGMAAGVSFGSGNAAETISVCTAIALQNIPEVMMIMPAMCDYGRRNALLAAAASGAVEMIGLLIGYAAVQAAVQILPILLSFAAGAMLYVIFENMLPDSYENGGKQTAVALLCGYCGMLLLTDVIARIV